MGKTNWFFDGGQKIGRKQKGLYELLVEKKGIPVETLIDLIGKYRETALSKCNSNRSRRPYEGVNWKSYVINEVCDEIFFPKFLELVTQETGITFKKRRRKKNNCYKDDFAERQLDYMMHGGSIEDF